MTQRFIAAALTLALVATGAAAFVAPSGKVGVAGGMAVPVVEPPPGGFKKSGVIVKKSAPILKKSTVIVKKAPVVTKKAPVVMKKVGPIISKSPPILKKAPVVKLVPGLKKMPSKFVFVKPYKKHKHYGRNVAGVVLGTILAASAFYAYTAPPEPGLCWYWVNSDRERGYWDYCEPPDDDD